MAYYPYLFATSCFLSQQNINDYYNQAQQAQMNYNNLYNESLRFGTGYLRDVYKCSYCLRETENKTENCQGCGAYSYVTVRR